MSDQAAGSFDEKYPAEGWISLRGPAGFGMVLIAATAAATLFLSNLNLYVFNTAMLAVLGASALNLLVGTAGQVSIGTAAFLAVGGFSTVALMRAGLPVPFDIIGGAACAGIVGLVFGLPSLRLRGLYLAVATLAAHFVVLYLADLYQTEVTRGAGFFFDPLFASRPDGERQQLWAWLLLGVVLIVLGTVFVAQRGRWGRALRLLREHEQIAAVAGVRVVRYKLTVFVLSSAIIGLQGGLYAHLTGSLTALNFSLFLAVNYIAMIVIGGLDSIVGAVLGAFLVTWLPQLVSKYADVIFPDDVAAQRGPSLAQVLYGVLIVVFVAGARDGLHGVLRRIGGALFATGRATRSILVRRVGARRLGEG